MHGVVKAKAQSNKYLQCQNDEVVPCEMYGRRQTMVLQKMCSLIIVVATTVVLLCTTAIVIFFVTVQLM